MYEFYEIIDNIILTLQHYNATGVNSAPSFRLHICDLHSFLSTYATDCVIFH